MNNTKKYIYFSAVIVCLNVLIFGGENNRKEDAHFLLQNENSKTLKLFLLDFTNYCYNMSVEEQNCLEKAEENLHKNIEKGLVSIVDWYVEEDETNWYIISRKVYSVINKNTVVLMSKYVCISEVEGSKYTTRLNFNGKKDPLLIEGKQYLFSDIKIGFMYQVDKQTKQVLKIPFFYDFTVI